MKKVVLALTAAIVLGLGNVLADNNGSTNVRTIKSPRFARALVEKWIEEYAKTQSGIVFQIATGQSESDLSISVVEDEKTNAGLVLIGETAVLPITARSSEAARLLEGKLLSIKKLKQLYFLNEDFEEDVKKNKAFESIIVYSGSNASSVASSFAHNFGEESINFRGKRISGDDLFLNTAIAKDPHGVTFNTLSNIYDLQSRQLKSNLSLIGLDLKKDIANGLNGNLDELLVVLENTKPAEIAIEKVAITFNNSDEATSRFLQWVLENGTKYNHQYGLLNLDQKVAKAQINQVANTLTAQK